VYSFRVVQKDVADAISTRCMFQDFVLIFCPIYWHYLSLAFVVATTCEKAALYTSRIGIITQGLDAVTYSRRLRTVSTSIDNVVSRHARPLEH